MANNNLSHVCLCFFCFFVTSLSGETWCLLWLTIIKSETPRGLSLKVTEVLSYPKLCPEGVIRFQQLHNKPLLHLMAYMIIIIWCGAAANDYFHRWLICWSFFFFCLKHCVTQLPHNFPELKPSSEVLWSLTNSPQMWHVSGMVANEEINEWN